MDGPERHRVPSSKLLKASSERSRSPHHLWFVGLTMDVPVRDMTVFTACVGRANGSRERSNRTRGSWRKLQTGVDTDMGRIVAPALTTKDVDDGPEVSPLLDQIDGPAAAFAADGRLDQDGVNAEVAA